MLDIYLGKLYNCYHNTLLQAESLTEEEFS